MSYDPKKKYKYNQCRHVDWHGKAVTQLHRFDGVTTSGPWRGVVCNTVLAFTDNDPQLVEVDEVLYYVNYYSCYTATHNTFEGALLGSQGSSGLKARSALHASGNIRPIPLDATTDPEGVA